MGKGLVTTVIILLLSFCFVLAEDNSSAATIMQGSELSTEIYVADSGVIGPTVIIIGGIHGDETAGVIAAEALIKLKPVKGKVVVLPRANKPACESNVRTMYYMEDLNRCFPGDKEGSLSEYAAAAIFEKIIGYSPSIVIDLHESKEKFGEDAASLGQSLIISEQGDSAEIVLDILEKLNEKVETGNEFTFTSGAPKGSLNSEISKLLCIPAITVETWSGQIMEARVKNHIDAVTLIIEYFNMLRQ